MLNKKICHTCFREANNFNIILPAAAADLEETFLRFWEYGKCYCVPQAIISNDNFNGSLISAMGSPPKECPYILEQTVTQN
jgi:hypothetical protein